MVYFLWASLSINNLSDSIEIRREVTMQPKYVLKCLMIIQRKFAIFIFCFLCGLIILTTCKQLDYFVASAAPFFT